MESLRRIVVQFLSVTATVFLASFILAYLVSVSPPAAEWSITKGLDSITGPVSDHLVALTGTNPLLGEVPLYPAILAVLFYALSAILNRLLGTLHRTLEHRRARRALERRREDTLARRDKEITPVRGVAIEAAANRLHRYDLLEELGRGGMGVVHHARDPKLDRDVAIKRILAERLGPDEVDLYKARFAREARAAGRLSHDSIVTVYDVGETADGDPYIVMEYVEGKTLSRAVDAGEVDFAKAIDVGYQIASALQYAHDRGVVHRDVKPANILLAKDGKTKLSDFGLARVEVSELTISGEVMGTPQWISPEQVSGAEVTGLADMFSLGAILYWMFTGQRPFKGRNTAKLVHAVLTEHPDPPTKVRPELPPAVDTILARCLAKDPKDRYSSAGKLASALNHLQIEVTGKGFLTEDGEKTVTISGMG